VSIGHRRFRVGIYWYVDIGTDGRSDPAYVKQESDASDGNWWASLDQVDGDEVIRGGKPEYRERAIFGFQYQGVPLSNPKGVVILWEETQQIFAVNAIIPRINNNRHEWQVKVQLMHESVQTATYSDGYYYAD
jgi:hypothetical protein